MINHSLKLAIKAELRLTDMCYCGFFFCRACRHVTRVDVDGPAPICLICHSPNVKFCPPVLDLPKPQITVRT